MAARRLFIVMLVLLGVSIASTALLPDATQLEEEREATDREPAPPPRPASGGRLVNERVDAGAGEPRTIALEIGDQLALTVRSEHADEVAIPAFGELAFVGPLAPARFDLLMWEAGTFPVRLVEADRTIAMLDVAAQEGGATEKPRVALGQPGNGGSEEPTR